MKVFQNEFFCYVFFMFWINSYRVKYARMRVFSDPYFCAEGQNLCFCPHTRKYASEKTRIMTRLGSVGALLVISYEFENVYRALLNSIMTFSLQRIVNSQTLLTIFAKISNMDVWLGLIYITANLCIHSKYEKLYASYFYLFYTVNFFLLTKCRKKFFFQDIFGQQIEIKQL